jgi:hypothetical protein
MAVSVKVHAAGLLNYVQAGRDAVTEVRKAMRRIANVARTEARRRIHSEFQARTGFLRRKARAMQTEVAVKSSEITARVKPIPRLMNIFERGATLTNGRGVLRPRPVVSPAQVSMDKAGTEQLNKILAGVGK